ncbi:MAG TPA: HD domain-containing protein [Vicinamibacterales bacterium]
MDTVVDADRLARQLAFLIECDRLKSVVRQTLNADARRQENSAEHSWAVCLFAMTLAEHSNVPIDVARVIRMLLVHDVVEIDAGDTFAYDTAGLADQHEREARAADRLFGLLPPDQAAEFRALWEEFEAQETPEARFAMTVDRLQPMLLNCLTEGAAWRRHGVTHAQVLQRNARMASGSVALWEHMRARLEDAVRRGFLSP